MAQILGPDTWPIIVGNAARGCRKYGEPCGFFAYVTRMLGGGRVDVWARPWGPRVVLTITNTGPVVPADAVDQILRPFQRLATPRTRSESSGLGLAIVRAIADSHGAELWVVPNPGGGLTVTVGFAAA